MAIEITGRSYEVPDQIRKLINTKLARITKYFADTAEIRCVLSVEKYRHLCEIVVHGKEYDLKAGQEAETMEEAVQLAVDHLKLQGQKLHRKARSQHRRQQKAQTDEWTVQVLERDNLRNEEPPPATPRIIQTSHLPIRPMSIEQAALILDDSRNEFIVFRDLDTDKVTVLYRRRDNNFGMIAPEF
ncbi:MAG TPA: ribosome-associated translation inhibitor RaiA [Thermoanaerobaculia bacterium]|nr:ribosome-associated translation inhibitor RaiA [Thermoanaerobaculia bacterium]